MTGLGLGQRRSARQIRENELMDKTKKINLKVDNSKVSECIYEVGASRKSKIALQSFREKSYLENFFNNSNAYAVFPDVVKGCMGLGGERGRGEVFQNCKAIGSTTMTQLTVGFQLGGQAFSKLSFFKIKKILTGLPKEILNLAHQLALHSLLKVLELRLHIAVVF